MKENAGEGGGGESDVLEFALQVRESSGLVFDPAVIQIPVGQRVKFTLNDDGHLEHDFGVAAIPAELVETVHGMGSSSQMGTRHHIEGIVAAPAMPGMNASVMFTPTRVGEYEFYCTIPGHKEAGMVGKLIEHQYIRSYVRSYGGLGLASITSSPKRHPNVTQTSPDAAEQLRSISLVQNGKHCG